MDLELSESKIEHKAAELLSKLGLENVFPVPVERIVEYLGYHCHFYIPDADVEDIAVAVSHAKRKIYINQNNSLQQQRFKIACKIGCILLHGDTQDYIGYLYSGSDPKEKLAEIFAENLLMPRAIFRKQWQATNKNIEELAQFFGVGHFVISSRANLLGLI